VCEVPSSNVDRVEFSVVAPTQGDDVGQANRVDCCEPPELPFGEVDEFSLGKGAHDNSPFRTNDDEVDRRFRVLRSRTAVSSMIDIHSLDDGYLENVSRRMVTLSTICYARTVAKGTRPDGLQAWMGLCEVVDRVRVALNRELDHRVGLTLAENLVLCQIAMAPEQRLRMVDIARLLAIAKSAVTKTVDRLEDQGFVARERHSGDRRTVYAALTKDGSKVFAAAQPVFEGAVNRHFTHLLDPSELRNLQQVAKKLLTLAQDSG